MITFFAISATPTLGSPLLLSPVVLRGLYAALGFRRHLVRHVPSPCRMPLRAASTWRRFLTPAIGQGRRRSIAITFVLPLLRFTSEAEREGRPRVERGGRGERRGDALLFFSSPLYIEGPLASGF